MATLQQAINVVSQDSTLTPTQTYCTPPSDAALPCSGNSQTGTRSVDGTGWVKVNLSAQTTVNVPTLPIDPANTGNYKYTYKGNASGYKLLTVLESTQQSPKMANDGGIDNNSYEVGTNLSIP